MDSEVMCLDCSSAEGNGESMADGRDSSGCDLVGGNRGSQLTQRNTERYHIKKRVHWVTIKEGTYNYKFWNYFFSPG